MDTDDWDRILKILQNELRNAGKPDIADIGNYYNDGNGESRENASKKLIHEMLVSLHGELCARSPRLLKHALNQINKITENSVPSKAALCEIPPGKDSEKSLEVVDDIPLENDDVSSAIARIEEVYKELFGYKIEGEEK